MEKSSPASQGNPFLKSTMRFFDEFSQASATRGENVGHRTLFTITVNRCHRWQLENWNSPVWSWPRSIPTLLSCRFNPTRQRVRPESESSKKLESITKRAAWVKWHKTLKDFKLEASAQGFKVQVLPHTSSDQPQSWKLESWSATATWNFVRSCCVLLDRYIPVNDDWSRTRRFTEGLALPRRSTRHVGSFLPARFPISTSSDFCDPFLAEGSSILWRIGAVDEIETTEKEFLHGFKALQRPTVAFDSKNSTTKSRNLKTRLSMRRSRFLSFWGCATDYKHIFSLVSILEQLGTAALEN
jgi:hypothetical protein